LEIAEEVGAARAPTSVGTSAAKGYFKSGRSCRLEWKNRRKNAKIF